MILLYDNTEPLQLLLLVLLLCSKHKGFEPKTSHMLCYILPLNYTPSPMITSPHVSFVDRRGTECTHGGWRTIFESQFFPFATWVPRIEFRSLVLDTSAFTC